MGQRELAGRDGLAREFFERPAHEVAPALLGHLLVHGPVIARITETEAYGLPGEDPASHTYRGPTRRNAVMFGPPGHLYVYFTYGMHFCANLVCLPEGQGSGVLLRAAQLIHGADHARTRRSAGAGRMIADRDLARGPARLAVSFGLAMEHNGLDCCAPESVIRVVAGEPPVPDMIRYGPRTGVAAGADTPWRFWIDGEPTVSPYRAHQPRARKPSGEQRGTSGRL
ncbi:DNA-3-methyladenine glycosylase [Rhizohabitans arisaemae]|uniref:DNA-3-methyladenine glycosylase n=1 Tax=Rhizohabitans arisaemae TaxID=2720610 RepID=UPI0024B06B9F|nr:DNA-3-methyladenine glycosylase [Rhizohabitans arisaemae]